MRTTQHFYNKNIWTSTKSYGFKGTAVLIKPRNKTCISKNPNETEANGDRKQSATAYRCCQEHLRDIFESHYQGPPKTF